MITRKLVRICATVSLVSGLIILIAIFLPVAEYVAESNRNYPRLLTPVVRGDFLDDTIDSMKTDYTRPDNWFVGASNTNLENDATVKYQITVPKLRIENATVVVGGEDLSKNLIQYPGTANPGRIGNTVIFGHSILPIFYNPKNYLAVFSTLNKLDRGDEIFVYAEGVTFRYEVVEKFEVLPTEIEVLDQDTDGRYISLITCTPPGHPAKPKRLVVRAKMVPAALNANANIVY